MVLWSVMSVSGVTASNPPEPHAIVQRMAKAYDGITDYTVLFLKRERTDEALPPVEKVRLRFQEPFKVHMTWITPNEGRMAVYIAGENDDKIQVNPGGFMQFMRVSLDPESPRAIGNGHHSIRMVGIRRMLHVVMEQYERAHQAGELTLRRLGRGMVDERPAHHLELIYPQSKDAGYYAYRAELWVDEEYFLPTKLLVYNWDNEIYEYYEYRQLKLNPGLGPEAFQLDPVPARVQRQDEPEQPDTSH